MDTVSTSNMNADSRAELARKLKAAEAVARRKAIKERSRFRGLQIRPTSSLFDESQRREPGEDNWRGRGFDIHPHVTIASLVVLVLFIVLTLVFRQQATSLFAAFLAFIATRAGWFLILAANIFVIGSIGFAFSRYGTIRIGGRDAMPEFSTAAWFAMLLSAGMGIGLMFWSVGEPIGHYVTPSPMFSGVAGNTPEAAQAAMAVTFFHWGIHPWAIYAIVGLGLAFFAYNRGLPLTIRSIFYPILGNRIYGAWGNAIDVLSVLATMTGLATSLGLGVRQVNAGLAHLIGLPVGTWVQLLLIAIITAFATISVVAGLDSGVKKLSEWNMGLAGIFMLFLLLAGPTIVILSGFTQNIGYYFSRLLEISFWNEAYRDTGWQEGNTLFYWAWWISWSPFVGMFIARISKGRTVKEFVLGVTLVPTILSFVWMSVFGGSAIFLQSTGLSDIHAAVEENVATALFAMLSHFPLAGLLSFVGIVLVVVFFVTSSDSGSLVVDHLTSGGKLDSPVAQRVFWAVMEGVVAAVLLLGGGLQTLQTASVATGLPFAIVLLVSIYSLYIGFKQELFMEDYVEKHLDHVRESHRISTTVDAAIADAISDD